MSRIFDPAEPDDMAALMTILRINPEIRLEMAAPGTGNEHLMWSSRGDNYTNDGLNNIRELSEMLYYRVAKDQS